MESCDGVKILAIYTRLDCRGTHTHTQMNIYMYIYTHIHTYDEI